LTRAPSFYVPIVDERSYDHLARQLLAGHPLDAAYFWQGPFYPAFLSAVYAWTNGSVLAARLAQSGLGAATAALSFRLGERIGGRRVGWIAGLTTALYGPLVFAEFELVATAWEAFLVVALLLLALRWCETPRAFWGLLLGLIGGLSIVTRATFVPFVAGLGVWLAIELARRSACLREGVTRWSLFAGGVLLVLVPVAVVNGRATGHFGVLPYSGGINLYIGNNPDRVHTLQIRPGPE
jgi:hypothetical protein